MFPGLAFPMFLSQRYVGEQGQTFRSQWTSNVRNKFEEQQTHFEQDEYLYAQVHTSNRTNAHNELRMRVYNFDAWTYLFTRTQNKRIKDFQSPPIATPPTSNSLRN